MSGANSVTINITLTLPGVTFSVLSFPANFIKTSATAFNLPVTFTVLTATTATVTVATPLIPPGTQFFNLRIPENTSSTAPIQGATDGDTVGSYTMTFNDSPQTTSGAFALNATFNGLPSDQTSGTSIVTINCIHGSSLISMRDGLKRVDQIHIGDEVVSGTNLDEYAQVKGIAHCWLSFLGFDHDAIIFEKDSLGPNEPDRKLIIDPGHPMCTQKEYLDKGIGALRPAGTYWEELKGDKIYTKKWTDTFVQEEPSRRYDLILEEPFNSYVANGMVIKTAGYKNHRYKEFK